MSESKLPVSFAWDKQAPISELNFEKIIKWKNVYASLFLFLSGQALHLLLTKYNFTVLTLVGRIILVQIIGFFLYIVGSRILKNTNNTEEIPLAGFKVTPEMIEPIVKAIVEKSTAFISTYVDILLCKDLGKTIKFAVAVQFVCWIGKLFSGITLLYLTFNILFIAPIVYEFKQKEIDNALKLVYAEAQKLLNQVAAKIPKSVTAFLEPKEKQQ